MIPTAFERPAGASADLMELEYISALHQTSAELRPDGSIQAIDIVHFLSSRYGINVTEREVYETILLGLGGGDEKDECIDLTELVGILLIPFLLKAAKTHSLEQFSDNDSTTDFPQINQELQSSIKNQEDASLQSDTTNIIGDVLDMILGDATGSTSPKKLEKDLIRKIFDFYGEKQLSEDDKVLEEMIMAASEGDENAVLDSKSFARALTGDILNFDVNNETSLTTNYFDVFKKKIDEKDRNESERLCVTDDMLEKLIGDDNESTTDLNYHHRSDEELAHESDHQLRPVKQIKTARAIDYIADTYRSRYFTSALWACFVAIFFSYLQMEITVGEIDCTQVSSSFGCKIANGLTDWVLVFLNLTIFGTIFIFFGSFGNTIYSESKLALSVGIITLIIFTIIPFFVHIKTPFFDTRRSDDLNKRWMEYVGFILGCVIIAMQTVDLLMLCFPKSVVAGNKRLTGFITEENLRREANVKRATSYKINKMMANAFEIHKLDEQMSSAGKTSQGRALLNFMKHGDKTEQAGGHSWTWKKSISGETLNKEGIWLSSRLIAGNVAVLFVMIFPFIALYRIIDFLNNIPDIDGSEQFDQHYRSVIIASASVGCFFGFLASLYLASIYIPSTFSTILKLRSGVIPTLHNRGFRKYRVGLDNVAYIVASMFWGAFYSSALIGVAFGVITFFFLWEVTRSFVLSLVAQIIGLTTTVLIKILVLGALRLSFCAAFYRKKPLQFNFMGLVLECWSMGTSIGFMFVRSFKLLFVTTLYLGRVDTPILATDVGLLGSVEIDTMPTNFLKDILAHEAHRHPYIERLGVMYMMKLRYGNEFAKASGTNWRMLFVFALMPWLRKYRVMARPELQEDDDGDVVGNFRWGEARVLRMSFAPSARNNTSLLIKCDDDEDLIECDDDEDLIECDEDLIECDDDEDLIERDNDEDLIECDNDENLIESEDDDNLTQ